MRRLAPAFALLPCASCMWIDPRASDIITRVGAPSVELAKDLDHEGVRAYSGGRYHDAALLFRESRRLGGPSIELWNEARCFERTSDLEHAAQVLEDFLSQSDLTPEDRAQAERELSLIQAKPSVITVTTAPPGAVLAIDGQPAGLSPTSLEVGAGAHVIAVRHPGYRAETQRVEARFGRGIVLELELVKEP
jgi:hypothetical protein